MSVGWDWQIAHYLGGVKHRNEPEPPFCVSAKNWLHPDIHIWVPCFLDPKDVKSLILGAIWNFSQRTGLP